MRCSITSKGLSLAQMEHEIKKVGGANIRKADIVGHLFAELDDAQVKKLSLVSGMKVRPVKVIRPLQVITEERQVLPAALPQQKTEVTISDIFYAIRDYFSPPISGVGLTVAVLDTGIRKEHESLKNKVIYEYNCTDSETVGDVFGHGTGVAYLVCGGVHGNTEKCGVSPGAVVMNIKVLNDEGIGTDETIIMGINKVCELAQQARMKGMFNTEEMYPNIINISIGAEDTGEEDDPIREACRKAVDDYAVDVVAAAGNMGPKRSTVMLPGAEPKVVAVGGVLTGSVAIWEHSSRGPTLAGDTKPDFVFWSTDIELASHKSNDGYDVKSGTSFATPMVAGLAGLLWETGRRSYGELWPFRWSQVLEFAPYYCTKPPDAAVVKDNTYGYGMPAMGTMIGQLSQPTGAGDITEMFPMVMMMAVMAGMMGGIV